MAKVIPKGFYIYLYYEPTFALPFYVGKGKDDRAWQHLQPSCWKLTPFYNKVKSLIDQGIQPEIEIIDQNLLESEAFALEKVYIQHWGHIPNGPLLNVTDGGDGISGHQHTEETRALIRAKRQLQEPWNPEQRQQIRERMLGNSYALGIKHSAEARLAKSIRQKGRAVEAFVGDRIFHHFDSIADARRAGFCSILRSIKEDKMVKGLYWRYQ